MDYCQLMKQNHSNIQLGSDGLSRRQFTTGLAALGVAGAAGAAGVAPMIVAPANAATLSIDEAVMPRYLGAEDAPIQIAEYYSMTCGHCAAFHNDVFPMVQSKLIDSGIVRFEMRPFPLDGLALRAHALVRSVPQQKFFPLVKILLAQHPVWVRSEDPLAALMKIARLAGVNANDFNTIMRNRELLEAIVKVRQIGVDDWQISSTPSFVINDDEVLAGNMSYEELAEKLSAFGA
jgi:protein-disulfide isomerase